MTTLSPETEAKILAKLEELTQDYEKWYYYSDLSCNGYESFSCGDIRITKIQLGSEKQFRLRTKNPSPDLPQLNQEALGQVFDRLVDLAQKDAINQILSAR